MNHVTSQAIVDPLKVFKPWVVLVFVWLLHACSSTYETSIQKGHDNAREKTAAAQQQTQQKQNQVPLVSEDPSFRFTQKSIPFVRSNMLPSSIGLITLRVPGRHNLSTAADLISNATGIPVIMAPDALMDAAVFSPGRGTVVTPNMSKDPSGEEAVLNNLSAVGAQRLALTDQVALNTVELNYSGSLAGLLNQIAARSRLRWTYEDDRIVFRRVVTRSITVKALPGSIRSNGSLALTSGSGNGATMNFNAETDTDFWVTLDKTLPLMVSSQGQFIVDAKLGVVTVRDAHDNVAAIEKMIESNNGLLMRQVAMHVEVLQVDLALEHQSGIDWNLVSDTLAKSNSLISLTGAPVLASNNIPATFGIKSINSSGQVSSQVLLKMLEKFGRVSTAYSSVLTTMNRQSVPVGVLNTLSYLKAITPATLTTGNSSPTNSGVGLVPGEITTGFSLNLIPMVMDSNRVLLQCSISISSLRELSKFSSGSGDNTQSIQQPSVDSFSSIQRMALNTGETMVIMGFERDESRSNQTDVVRNQIPGSRMASSNRKSTVILVTPRLIGI